MLWWGACHKERARLSECYAGVGGALCWRSALSHFVLLCLALTCFVTLSHALSLCLFVRQSERATERQRDRETERWKLENCWAEAHEKIARMTLTIKLDRNWSSFQLANSAPPLSVTDSAIAPSARMTRYSLLRAHICYMPRVRSEGLPYFYSSISWIRSICSTDCISEVVDMITTTFVIVGLPITWILCIFLSCSMLLLHIDSLIVFTYSFWLEYR